MSKHSTYNQALLDELKRRLTTKAQLRPVLPSLRRADDETKQRASMLLERTLTRRPTHPREKQIKYAIGLIHNTRRKTPDIAEMSMWKDLFPTSARYFALFADTHRRYNSPCQPRGSTFEYDWKLNKKGEREVVMSNTTPPMPYHNYHSYLEYTRRRIYSLRGSIDDICIFQDVIHVPNDKFQITLSLLKFHFDELEKRTQTLGFLMILSPDHVMLMVFWKHDQRYVALIGSDHQVGKFHHDDITIQTIDSATLQLRQCQFDIRQSQKGYCGYWQIGFMILIAGLFDDVKDKPRRLDPALFMHLFFQQLSSIPDALIYHFLQGVACDVASFFEEIRSRPLTLPLQDYRSHWMDVVRRSAKHKDWSEQFQIPFDISTYTHT